MILTVTLNAAIDKRYVVEGFRVGEVNRVKECAYTPGGKGLNVSKPVSIAGAAIGHEVGLIDEKRYQNLLKKEEQIAQEIDRVNHTNVGTSEKVQQLLDSYGSTRLTSGTTLAELIRRPELSYDKLKEIDEDRPDLPWDVAEQVNINIKYEGYIKRQMKQVEQFKKLENRKIPENIDYNEIQSLRIEAKQKLSQIRPASIGQASRISGVSPADISVLLVYLSAAGKTSDK